MCTPSPPSHSEWGPRTQPRPSRHGCPLWPAKPFSKACPLVLSSLTCGSAHYSRLTL